jgi:hypothetical protein
MRAVPSSPDARLRQAAYLLRDWKFEDFVAVRINEDGKPEITRSNAWKPKSNYSGLLEEFEPEILRLARWDEEKTYELVDQARRILENQGVNFESQKFWKRKVKEERAKRDMLRFRYFLWQMVENIENQHKREASSDAARKAAG